MADKTVGPVAFLPKSTNQDYQPPARGQWSPNEAQLLTQIAGDFDVLDGLESPHSIPDVWKRPLIFADTLCRIPQRADGVMSPLEIRIMGEWRGMLGILAFWGTRGWDWLKAEAVAFPLPGDELKPGFVEVQKPGFMKVLHELRPDRPEELIFSDVTWQRFHVLLGLDGQPFGLISPMSLVCTAEDYTGRLSEVPWLAVDPKTRKSFLTNPLVGPHLSSREKKWLAQWIAYLRTEITRLGQTNSGGRKLGILTQLTTYEKEANGGKEATPFSTAHLRPTGIVLANSQNSVPPNKLYKLLDKPIGTTGAPSDVEVVQRVSGAARNRYFLIEPSLEDQWDRAARDIIVYGNLTLGDGVPKPKLASDLISGTSNCYWCTKDFFLEKRIIVFTESGALPGQSHLTITSAGKRTPLPPLRKEALGLISAGTLAENLNIEWIGDTIVARLSVDLQQSGTDGETQVCVIERLYQGDDIQEVDGANIPVAKIWPNFTAPSWKVYYTYVGLTGRELKMEPFPLLRVPTATDPAESEPRDYTDGAQGFMVYRTSSFPEALVCTLALDSSGAQRQDTVSAVLPLKPPDGLPVPTTALGSLVVGVDFGSTGSIVFRKASSNNVPDKFTIKRRLYSVTKESRANELRTDRDFLPDEERESNDILSVFQVHGDPRGGDEDRLPFSDGHILFLKTPENFIDETTRNVQTNLKWGNKQKTYLAGSFLDQLCLQTAAESFAEGATSIEWRFSYPTAFDDTRVATFNKIWGALCDKVKLLTGVSGNLAIEGSRQEYCEAVCAARYFKAKGEMNTVQGALSVDIGGGTSDYALWRDDRLTLHNSVLLAGRDIFLAALRKKPKFLASLDSRLGPSVSDIDRLRLTDPNAANAQIDAIIARNGDRLLLAMAHAHEERAVKGFCRLIATGISGILYYGGLLVRHQADPNAKGAEGNVTPVVPETVFGIYAGGNGCKLFQWAFGDTFDENSAVASRLGGIFQKASGFSDNVTVKIRLSKAPKSEVGYGLVASPPQDLSLRIAGQTAGLLACESFYSGAPDHQVKYVWEDSPPIVDVHKYGIRVDPELPEFTRFLTAIGVTLDAVQRDRLVASVNTRLAEVFGDTMKAPTVAEAEKVLPRGEPVWIVVFKAFLEEQIDAWSGSV